MAVAGKGGKVVIGDGAAKKVVGIKSWSLELSLDAWLLLASLSSFAYGSSL